MSRIRSLTASFGGTDTNQLNVALQHFIAILGRPNEVVTMVENAMFAREILQVLILLKNEP
jgi:hypothetical protein